MSRKFKNRKQNQVLERTVIARIPQAKYDELQTLLSQSRVRTMSELLRHILENRKITIEHYDKTIDKLINELSGIRKELLSIGININQVTKRFHTQSWPEAMILNAKEIDNIYQQTGSQIQRLLGSIEQISKKWLLE